jgi:ribosomal protein S18 acetylase RimI-like enzyme
MTDAIPQLQVRNTQPRDFAGIADLCRRVYPDTPPWTPEQLNSHLRVFPQGQFVAMMGLEERVVGMAASCIVRWDHYHMLDDWETFTANGMFTNYDPEGGHTLYGAEAIVDPTLQGHGIGRHLYAARRAPVEQLRLWWIRAGARLRDYHTYTKQMTPAEYVIRVVHGLLHDRTLSFQLHERFHVLAVVPHYLSDDPESLGYAAVIEWLNLQVMPPEHYADRPTQFLHRDVAAQASRGLSGGSSDACADDSRRLDGA